MPKYVEPAHWTLADLFRGAALGVDIDFVELEDLNVCCCLVTKGAASFSWDHCNDCGRPRAATVSQRRDNIGGLGNDSQNEQR